MQNEEEAREIPRMPEGVPAPTRKYRFQTKKADIEKHGPSEDCDGCSRAITGESQRPHTDKCRERFEILLHHAGDPRILSEVDRLEGQREIARQMVESEPVQIRSDEVAIMEIKEHFGR